MKRISLPVVALAILFAACNEKTSDKMKDTGAGKDTAAKMEYAYKAQYSSDISMGKPEHVKIVFDFFKAWENNRLDDMRPLLTDSVWVEFSDGTRFLGNADSLISEGKKFRANFDSVGSVLDAYMPVHLNDKNEDFVLVWGKDYMKDKTGKLDSIAGHSYWQVKDNKICGWAEYTRKLTAVPPPGKNP
ncbi:MAG TPA: hypothetical protein VEB63_02290 [Chitinophagaceae bacterium]|nr:hypothetical protein [Chitinophagaceae bacterium]